MGGVTIAHQHEVATSAEYNNYSKTETMPINEEQLSELLGHPTEWANNGPVEDLTGEVEELMMRESVNSWLQQPWTEENGACLVNQMYAESMQLEELFGQNFNENLTQTAVLYDMYDDLSVNQSSSSASSSAQPSPVTEKPLDLVDFESEALPIVEQLPQEEEPVNKRRRSVLSSDDSSDASSSEEDEEESDSETEEIVIPTTVANMNSRVVYSSDSDSESEMIPGAGRSRASSPNTYMYMHKRQIEETLLDRITNQLHPEKLPGILPILSSDKANSQQEDEIEIDLSCLAREQLVQILLYVDACILEQEGGPAVNVEDYIKKKGPRTRPAVEKKRTTRRRPAMPKRTKTRAELTEDIDADSCSSDEEKEVVYKSSKPMNVGGGPMSMASLSMKKKTNSSSRRKSRKSRKTIKDDDAALISSVTVIQDPNSIASSRPKRRSALHKRRLLEEMLAPSEEEEEEEEDEDSQIVVFGDEEMDFGILGNETIVHQVPVPVVVPVAPVIDPEMAENTDDEIDIMF